MLPSIHAENKIKIHRATKREKRKIAINFRFEFCSFESKKQCLAFSTGSFIKITNFTYSNDAMPLCCVACGARQKFRKLKAFVRTHRVYRGQRCLICVNGWLKLNEWDWQLHRISLCCNIFWFDFFRISRQDLIACPGNEVVSHFISPCSQRMHGMS